MTFPEVIAQLQRAFARPLPGPAAQARLAPRPMGAMPEPADMVHMRHAAGLLLVFPATASGASDRGRSERRPAPFGDSASQSALDAHIVLTVRAERLRHAGQVSLPGGVVEPGETFEQAALREAHEEVALRVDQVRHLGALSPIDIAVSGFRLHPLVGAMSTRPDLTPSDDEVARILEVSVNELLGPEALVRTRRERGGVPLSVPAFRVSGVEIWGATAMVLAEFLTLLGWNRTAPP